MQPAQTPEEAKWMASVFSQEKAKRRLKYAYILLAVSIVAGIGWSVSLIISLTEGESFSVAKGLICAVFILSIVSALMTLTSVRQIANGKQPL